MKPRLTLSLCFILLMASNLWAQAPLIEGVPETYTIKRGDTLWDISGRFLKDPFKWRVVWRLNPFIKNPNLIYPWQIIRLLPVEPVGEIPPGLLEERVEEVEPVAETPTEGPTPSPVPEIPPIPPVVKVSYPYPGRGGFISPKTLEGTGSIVASKDERLHLHKGDLVFTSFNQGTQVKAGDRFTIFSVDREVRHPANGRVVGFIVDVLGILEVIEIGKDVATARIDVSYKEIPLGARLKPFSAPVREVVVKKGGIPVSGIILDSMEDKVLLSQNDIVYIDIGRDNGVEVGNLFNIYRLREGKKGVMLPPLELGTMLVVDTQEDTSTAFIIKSYKTIMKGDRVEAVGS